MFMVGYAYLRGLLPLSKTSIERAIDLNGVAVDANKRTFAWGRLAAHNPAHVEQAAAPLVTGPEPEAPAQMLDDVIGRRVVHLTAYQNAAYAERYRLLVERAQVAEMAISPDQESFTAAVARSSFKLMAYKDEYEVARLYAEPAFTNKLNAQFEGAFKLRFNMAPPLLARRDPATGRPRKIEFGAWMLPALRVLAKLKFLRGSVFDPFGYSEDRRAERRAIDDFEATVAILCAELSRKNHESAVAIAELPDRIRGFGYVKENNRARVVAEEAQMLAKFGSPGLKSRAAE